LTQRHSPGKSSYLDQEEEEEKGKIREKRGVPMKTRSGVKIPF